ncbi:hypothetical protein [Aureispira anguillae]|nr:hypothetical protein [Aureispira anguillae]
MNYYSFFALSLILSLLIPAQTQANNELDQLFDNTDITWAAEVYTDYVPNINSYQFGKKEMKKRYGISRNNTDILKIQNEVDDQHIHPRPAGLAHKLFQLTANNFKAFKDASLKEQLSYDTYKDIVKQIKQDTVFTFNPATSKETMQVIVRELNPNEVEIFRVKQILHYNAKTNQLGVTPIAIAPILTTYSSTGEITKTTPLFWMPITEISQAMDLSPSNINWAKRLSRSISTDQITVIKGKGQIGDIVYSIIEKSEKNADKAKLYHTFGNFTPLEASEIKNIRSSIDTIITFNPTTFEEIVQVVSNKLDPQSVQKIRIIQNWVWDKRTQQMNIRLIAFAPIVNRYDEAKNFLNSGPMFYKKPNE